MRIRSMIVTFVINLSAGNMSYNDICLLIIRESYLYVMNVAFVFVQCTII